MFVEITHGIKAPLASKSRQPILVPLRAFKGAVRAWKNSGSDEDVMYRGVRIREVYIYTKTGRRVPKKRTTRQVFADVMKSRYAIRFSYGKHWFCMWRVTWAYIASHASGLH